MFRLYISPRLILISWQVNPNGDKGETIAADVKEGVYRILFKHDRLGYNQVRSSFLCTQARSLTPVLQSWQADTMLPAIESAPREGFSLSAKNSIESDYEDQIEEVNEKINELVGATFTLDPNFEENYKTLSAANKDNKDWQGRIGSTVLSYFQGLQSQLESQGASNKLLQ